MSYKKTTYSPQALKVAAAENKAKPTAPAVTKTTAPQTKTAGTLKPTGNPSPSSSRQEIDVYLKHLTQLVESDPQKAAEVFKSWLDKPSKIVKPKRAA